MRILLTGGAGFIGSHMAGFLLKQKIPFTIVDNLSNADLSNIRKLELKFQQKIELIKVDLRDKAALHSVLAKKKFSAIIHFAALKSVEESIKNPELYFDNNVEGTKVLMEAVKNSNIKQFIYSSSACVYGDPNYTPIDENHALKPTSPYGETKVACEKLLQEDSFFSKDSITTILRYFNPVGAFDGGLIGEVTLSQPTNLMPNLILTALQNNRRLNIYGNDYDTKDGSTIRDFIHIMDLVEAHFYALKNTKPGISIYNVGTGRGYTIQEMISTFEHVNNVKIPINVCPRRLGDIAVSFADVNKIQRELRWAARFNLKSMCEDAFMFAKLKQGV
jgi:UDP-glucose 4-epimerase